MLRGPRGVMVPSLGSACTPGTPGQLKSPGKVVTLSAAATPKEARAGWDQRGGDKGATPPCQALAPPPALAGLLV